MLTNKVEICGVNTNKLPILKENVMRELLIKIKGGDEKARDEFINGNLRLVLSVIKRFYNRGENLDDLFQVGTIGLIKAIDNFNINLNVRFSTYAVPMIIGEIRRHLRDNNSLRVSRSLKDTAYKALQTRNILAAEKQCEPTVEDIAAVMHAKREDVVFALDAIQDPVSLFEPVYHDSGDAIYVMDQIKDEKTTDENWITGIAIKEAIKKLSEREKDIINKRFYLGQTQMEVAKEIGISQAQVSRLEKNALKNIKKAYSE